MKPQQCVRARQGAISSRDVLKLVWLLIVGATICCAPAFGQDADAASLKGITRLQIVIEDISRDAGRAGLTKAQVQSDIEVWLRQKGITIDSRAPQQLYVSVDTANNSTGGYAYARVDAMGRDTRRAVYP
jgi:hypothetical protein